MKIGMSDTMPIAIFASLDGGDGGAWEIATANVHRDRPIGEQVAAVLREAADSFERADETEGT